MKRIYTILSVVFLLFAMLMGLISTFDKDATYSEAEKRKLKTRPKMTISGLIDGTYFNDYREYFADTYRGRNGYFQAWAQYARQPSEERKRVRLQTCNGLRGADGLSSFHK